jgi:hypothetical protein
MLAFAFARARTVPARHETVNMWLLICTSALTPYITGRRRWAKPAVDGPVHVIVRRGASVIAGESQCSGSSFSLPKVQ